MNHWVITTPYKASDELSAHVETRASSLGATFVTRRTQTLAKLSRAHNNAPVAVLNADGIWQVRSPKGEVWRWHPGLAHIRVAATRAGQSDRLVRVLSPLEGRRVLDANLGLGRDALVLADAGATVVGLEIDPVLCAITQDGLRHLDSDLLADAATRITCQAADQRVVLPDLSDDSFDRVYFSPMFEAPDFDASDMTGLRQVATFGAPDEALLAEALRVAPQVVIKLEHHATLPLPPPTQLHRKRRTGLAFAVYLRNP